MIENLRELIQELETETETPSIQELEKLLKDEKYITATEEWIDKKIHRYIIYML